MSAKLTAVLGTSVVKGPLGLPATATTTLFTVSGAVMITGMFGLVTTGLGATVTNLSLGTVNDAGTSIATATAVTSKAAGTWLMPSSTNGVGGALVANTAPFFPNTPAPISPFVVNGNITWTTSATDTGQIKWYLWYMPLDFDATVS